jgi:DNA-binding NarL/FixJ family response regulator
LELVAVAATVADALLLVQRHAPNVVVMDHGLPDGDGAEASKAILLERSASRSS